MTVIDEINRIVRASRDIFIQTGAEPTPEEIGRKLGMTPERVRALLNARKPVNLMT
jgi:RNA polymerase primary sigma factor